MTALRNVTYILAPGLLPFAWAALFAVFALAYRLLQLPEPAEIVDFARTLLAQRGPYILLAASFIEGIFMISVYFPGSLVIAVAVFLSDRSISSLAAIGVLTWAGLVAALPVNYYLGSRGFYRSLLILGRRDVVTRMRLWLSRRGRFALFMSAFHPTVLSVAMVCMGIAGVGMRRSVSLAAIALVPWIALVIALLCVVSPHVDVSDRNQAWYFISVLVIWGVCLVISGRRWRSFDHGRSSC